MKAKFALLGLMSLVAVGVVQAQDNWKWPEDTKMESKAREYNASYNDYRKAGQFVEATKPLNWLLVNTPDINEAIYINGVEVYAGAADQTSDEAQARIYQDSVMTIYELRNEKYQNEARWIENKAYYAYKFFKTDKDKVGEAAKYFEKAIEIHGELSAGLVPAYFDVVYRNFAFNKAYTPEEVLDIYQKLNTTLDKAESEGKDVSSSRGTLDQILVVLEIIDCDFIENKLGPKLTDDPSDIKLAKQIFQYAVQYKCTSSPVFLNALEIIDNDNPTFSTSQVRGMRYLQNKEYEKAGEMFERALTLADTDERKAEVQYELAKVQANLGQKSSARESAKKAAELDGGLTSKAWSFIGSLYMGSSNDCRGGQSRVKDYSIFLAAYDAFARAGDNSGMASAKSRFPSKEELFSEGYQEGQEINTGCWIGQTVSLRTRD